MPREYPYPPRMMTRARASHYCDLSPADFDKEVAAGRLPAAVKLANKDHWSRVALDEALEQLTGEGVADWRKGLPLYAA